ncbi:MAG: hypothetical protein HDR92_00595 [Bacteroides sp.]|nr:hypothetical protein [Bacteroides sp.]
MTNDKKHIFRPLSDDDARRLRALFEAGETTVEEERALYAYFRTASLPPDLSPLRGLMAWYEGGCKGEPSTADCTRRPQRSLWLRTALVSAASVAVLFAVGFSAYRYHKAEQSVYEEFAELYKGSYVIRDGVKITDPNLIYADVMEANRVADSINDLIAMNVNQSMIIYEAVKHEIGGTNPSAVEKVMHTINLDF